MQQVTDTVERFMTDEDGVTMIEYGLLAALIALACIVAVTAVGTSLNGLWGRISAALDAAG